MFYVVSFILPKEALKPQLVGRGSEMAGDILCGTCFVDMLFAFRLISVCSVLYSRPNVCISRGRVAEFLMSL